MWRRGQSKGQGVVVRVTAAVALVVLAGVLGSVLGSWRPNRVETSLAVKPPAVPGAEQDPATPDRAMVEPPLYFYGSIRPGSDIEAVAAEVKMAAAAGIHNHILQIQLPWPELQIDANAALYPLDRIEQEDPEANILLAFSLNPPDSWFAVHPEASASADPGRSPYPSIASDEWIHAAKQALSSLIEEIDRPGRGARVSGFVLGALEDDRWIHAGDYDRSPANILGFRDWLRNRYPDDTALAEAWGDAGASLATADIPTKPDTADQTNVFFAIPEEQQLVDYLRYISENTADAIATLAGHVHQTSQRYLKLYVPYGHSFELTANDAGHCALGLLLDGDVQGFISPVSYQDRGLGGAGGYMGPVNSAGYHARQWIVVDDTRTGVSRNAATGDVERIEGLRADDVIRVLRRNFAASLVHGIGLAWSDWQGTGALYDPRLWEEFTRMRAVYDETWNADDAPRPGESIEYPTREKRLTLMVVVDEASRFYQRCDARLNELILLKARDAALRSGVPTQFCLLQDVLDGHAASAAVYLFVNAFHLHPSDRENLRNILIANSAAAIWLYAPGAVGDGPPAENVSATTGLPVKQFDGPAMGGSAYQLDGGRWMKKGQEFGLSERWSPLFFIDLPATKVLAKYRANQRPSVALDFFENGWASIYIADPGLPTDLLREILVILEKQVAFQKAREPHSNTAYFGPKLYAVHASSDGEHSVYFDNASDAQDLLEPEIGWLNKIYIDMSMRLGDTRVLRVTPATSDELPEEVPEEMLTTGTNAGK